MIGPTGAVRVMVATKPVNFRKGMDGLAREASSMQTWTYSQPTPRALLWPVHRR